ncbi:hypothetical protein KDW_40670 [Dictyobacter vulcani]|uniref:Uncharacterized protein n=1 Tax=Dictyobacter vulcani TaxID=2607529 RepID=A0A5J4KPW6_9CHLR|nr:hypothetical protein [Dictyobacter vulcani]GER89905.1 hypothetical protein KDW_40670 [Dictyobacter vulcani]
MKTITLNLEDEMFARVVAIAKQAGIAEQDTTEWAAEQIRKNLSELLPSGSSKWMPREQEEQYLFIDDLTRSARAIEKVFTPLKMSIDMGSSRYPHLYCRLKPRYYGDAAPEQRMSHAAERLLDPLEYEKYVTKIRVALAQ